jgi:hypothetical protein
LQERFGTFPLFHFWGPKASIESSNWIADAARFVDARYQPTLLLVYLPHLDYALQKLGPEHPEIPKALAEIDGVAGDLIDYLRERGRRIIAVSEYGIEPAVSAIEINRLLRQDGAIRVREEQGLELLDPGASDAFAVADHQVAHVYVKDPGKIGRFADFCRGVPGVAQVLDRDEQAAAGLAHERSGDLVLVAAERRWFSYNYWLDDAKAPDFARTVDIHRKPGYDPAELFVDPRIQWPLLNVGWKLLKRRLGFRTLLDVIPLDPGLVRGTHGRVEQPRNLQPLLIVPEDIADRPEEVPSTTVRDVILEQLFGDGETLGLAGKQEWTI